MKLLDCPFHELLGEPNVEPEYVWGFRQDGHNKQFPEREQKRLRVEPDSRSCWPTESAAREASRFYLNAHDFRAIPLDLVMLSLECAGVKTLVMQDGDLKELRRWDLRGHRGEGS